MITQYQVICSHYTFGNLSSTVWPFTPCSISVATIKTKQEKQYYSYIQSQYKQKQTKIFLLSNLKENLLKNVLNPITWNHPLVFVNMTGLNLYIIFLRNSWHFCQLAFGLCAKDCQSITLKSSCCQKLTFFWEENTISCCTYNLSRNAFTFHQLKKCMNAVQSDIINGISITTYDK